MSLVEQLIPLQRRLNAEMRSMTPAQRAAAARDSLRAMPGQAYLFVGPNEDDDPETAHPGQWEQS